MRLVLLIIGAVVAQVWHEDDPQDDATRQLWFEEAREAVLDMDENFAASYDARASAQSHRRKEFVLITQGNLANTYHEMGRLEHALSLRRETYSGFVKLLGEENRHSLLEALNFASALATLQRFKEAKSLMRKTIPMARRVFGKSHDNTLKLTWSFARTLYEDPGATLDDLRESVTTHEETARIARRVLGGTHPTTMVIEESLQNARAALRARETPTDELDEVENA